MKKLFFSLSGLLFLSQCSRLQTIPHDTYTPGTWCKGHPCVPFDFGFGEFILTEPTSTVFVYALGLLALFLGVRLIRSMDDNLSRQWFGAALMFWGIAALSAGTSYQAFSYEIKCSGREICAWTSWFEIVYYMFQACSMNAFLVAVGYSSAGKRLRKVLKYYAVLNVSVYTVILLTGAFLPDKFMVSFELFVLFTGPNFLVLFVINAVNFYKRRELLEFRLMILWVLQGGVMVLYYGYLLSGVQKGLWEKGIWFTANDVLHLALIGWMVYIAFGVIKLIKDREDNPRLAPVPGENSQ